MFMSKVANWRYALIAIGIVLLAAFVIRLAAISGNSFEWGKAVAPAGEEQLLWFNRSYMMTPGLP